jgi:hypothetical protein
MMRSVVEEKRKTQASGNQAVILNLYVTVAGRFAHDNKNRVIAPENGKSSLPTMGLAWYAKRKGKIHLV